MRDYDRLDGGLPRGGASGRGAPPWQARAPSPTPLYSSLRSSAGACGRGGFTVSLCTARGLLCTLHPVLHARARRPLLVSWARELAHPPIRGGLAFRLCTQFFARVGPAIPPPFPAGKGALAPHMPGFARFVPAEKKKSTHPKMSAFFSLQGRTRSDTRGSRLARSDGPCFVHAYASKAILPHIANLVKGLRANSSKSR